MRSRGLSEDAAYALMRKTAMNQSRKIGEILLELRLGEAQPEGQDLTPVVGKNLRRFRSERGLSLEGLSKVSGVSRAMLGQIELGHSTPTMTRRYLGWAKQEEAARQMSEFSPI